MSEQYFTQRPRSPRHPTSFEVTIRGRPFRFYTEGGVFSAGGLDRGTELLLEALDVGPCELILDLGCGYGALGIVAAHLSQGGRVILTDVNRRAANLATKNLRANAIENGEVHRGDLYAPVGELAFDHILCNPPIRAGRELVARIIHGAPQHLLDGGRLWLVVRTKQGGHSLERLMAETFGNATVVKRGSGYRVLQSTWITSRAPLP